MANTDAKLDCGYDDESWPLMLKEKKGCKNTLLSGIQICLYDRQMVLFYLINMKC